MFACQLPGRRASNSVLPPIDLTVRYGADIIRYRRDDQRLDRLPRGLGGRQRPRSKEAATVRRSVPGARRGGPRARRFSVDGARTDTHRTTPRCSTLVGCLAVRERPNGRRARDKAPSWQPRGRARERPSPSARQKKSAACPRGSAAARALPPRHKHNTSTRPKQPCDRAARSQARVPTTKR